LSVSDGYWPQRGISANSPTIATGFPAPSASPGAPHAVVTQIPAATPAAITSEITLLVLRIASSL